MLPPPSQEIGTALQALAFREEQIKSGGEEVGRGAGAEAVPRVADGAVELPKGLPAVLGKGAPRVQDRPGLPRDLPGGFPTFLADDEGIGHLGQDGEIGLDDRVGKAVPLVPEARQ